MKRVIIYVACLFLPLFVQAQFVDVDWSSGRSDSLLPVCSSVVDLPSDYSRYSYSAHVEYPELQRMTDEDVRRYSLPLKYGLLPELPSVECYIGIQAKQPQLDMAFIPVVMRGGEYYRINSYKLVVDKKLLPQRTAPVSHVAGERYASSSVLAAGKWVRIAVKDNGVHKITHSELKKMGFKDPGKVRLFGYGGHILPETNIADVVDDLCEVPLWRENTYILFYANGVVRWKFDSNRFVHEQNVYSEYGCYFLTESDDEPMQFMAVADEPTTQVEFTSFPDYVLHENEAKSLCSYGRVLVDNYDYSQGRSVNYKFPVSGIVQGTATVDISFATNGLMQSRVSASVGENNIGSMTVSRVTGGEMGKIVSAKFDAGNVLGDNPVVRLTHSVSDNSVTGFLDYLRLNFTRALSLYGSQTTFRGNLKSGYAKFKISGCNNNTRVWDVTDPSGIKELSGSLEGDVYSVVAPASRESRLVVLDVKGMFPSVTVVGNVPNQNLHGMGPTDMVIIVPSNGSFIAAAEKLADAHRRMDGLNVAVVTAQQVYNEFSSGTPDVTAYRRLMKMLYDRAVTAEDAPKYLLLFGDSWSDNRLITFPGYKQDNYLLCYESVNSVDAIQSYVLEDYIGFLDDNEGGRHMRDKVDIGIGRIPARSAAEALAVVDKTIAYMENRDAGAWQNIVALLADDGDVSMPNQHMKDADSIAVVMGRTNPLYLLDRIYWDDFEPEPSSTGLRYPAVTGAINDCLDRGALIVNYSGHGSANLLSHEMAWKASDMSAVNSPRMPFWVTASCDIGPFDIGDNSVAEAAIMNPNGAAIGLFTTTRTVMQNYNSVINKAFMSVLLPSEKNPDAGAVGDAVRRAKCNVISLAADLSVNKLQYVLLGDPALRLKAPSNRLVVERFNGADASAETQVSAGGLLTVEGYLADAAGNIASDFTGVLYSTLFDSAVEVCTRDNSGIGAYTYTDYIKTLFAGSDSVVNGRFSITLPVPMDISYSDEPGMLSLFAVDSSFCRSAHGRYDGFTVGGTASGVTNDGKGPEIKLYLNTSSFVDGDEVNASPCLWAELYDENGINTIGSGIGHDIVAIIDNNPDHTYNLNNVYTPMVGDYTRGLVKLPLKELPAGEHTLLFRAWDLYNNSSVATLNFFVEPSLAPDFVGLVVNPSPVVYGSPAKFILTHNRPQSEIEVTIDIFSMQGQLLWSDTERVVCDGVEYCYEWNGAAADGSPLPTGLYLVRAYIASNGAVSSTKTRKMLVVNNK